MKYYAISSLEIIEAEGMWDYDNSIALERKFDSFFYVLPTFINKTQKVLKGLN